MRCRLTGLEPNTRYLLRVVSVNTIGVGPPSQEVSLTSSEEGTYIEQKKDEKNQTSKALSNYKF
jgi:hypothetical protein